MIAEAVNFATKSFVEEQRQFHFMMYDFKPTTILKEIIFFPIIIFRRYQKCCFKFCTEAGDGHKLQVPGLSYNWWGFQAWGALRDSTDNSGIDKVETSLEWQECLSQFQDTTDALPCHVLLPVCLWIMDPHSKAPKKNTSHWNEVLPHDTTHLIQRPCCQRGSRCQDPVGNQTTRRPPDHRKETQTAVVWTCLPVIRSGQNHLARHSERGKKTRQTEKRWEDNIRERTGLISPRSRWQWRTEKNGGNWLWNHLWCPIDPRD